MATRVGIELSPAACRIVEIEGSAPWRRGHGDTCVRSFAVLPPSGPEMRAKLKSLRRRRAAVIVWGGRSEHRQVMVSAGSYESMRAEAIASLAAAGLPTSGVWADIAPASPADDRAPRRPVVVSMASAGELTAVIRPLREAGIRVRTVTTPAVALASLARTRQAFSVPGAIESYVAFEEQVTCIALVRNGVLLAARDLPWGFIDEDYAHSAPRSRDDMTTRLSDAISEFVAAIGGSPGDIGQVCVCGGLPELRSMSAALMERLDVEVEPLDSLFGIDAARLPEPADEFRERGAELRLAWAAAADWPPAINLLRARRRQASKTWLARAAVVAGAAAGLGGSWWVVERSHLWPAPAPTRIASNTPARGRGPLTTPAPRATPPVVVNRPPVVTPPPAVVNRPPVVTPPPAVVNRPPVVTPPPAVVNRPPVVTPPPAVVNKPSVVTPPPAVVNKPPVVTPPPAVVNKPSVVTPPPAVVNRPPVVTPPPAVVNKPPVVTPPPAVVNKPPVVTPPPAVVNRPPVVTPPPAVVNKPPVVTPPPAVVNKPPVVTPPPAVVNKPPVVMPPPAVVNRPPVVTPPPAVVNKPPVVTPPPAVVNKPPVVMPPPAVVNRPPVVTPPPAVVNRPPVVTPPPAVVNKPPVVTPPPAVVNKPPVVTPPPAVVNKPPVVTPPPAVVNRPPVVTPPPAVVNRPPIVTPPPAAVDRSPVAASFSVRPEPAPARVRPAPPPEAALPFDAVLGTILYSADRKLAIIDNRIVGVGDEVRGARVTEITAGAVLLRDAQGQLRRLALGAGGR